MPLSRSKRQSSGCTNAPCPVAGARHLLSPYHRSRTGKPTNLRQRTDRSSTGRTLHRPAAQVNPLGTATHDAAHGSRNPAFGRPPPPPVGQSRGRRTGTSRATRLGVAEQNNERLGQRQVRLDIGVREHLAHTEGVRVLRVRRKRQARQVDERARLKGSAVYPDWNPFITRVDGDFREGATIRIVLGTGSDATVATPVQQALLKLQKDGVYDMLPKR